MADEKYLFHLKNLAFEVIIPWFTPDCNVFRGRWGAVCFWELLCYDKEKGGVDMDGILSEAKQTYWIAVSMILSLCYLKPTR